MPHVVTKTVGAIATLTISNPPHGYMTATAVEELDRAFRAIEADEAVKVAIITGGQPGVFIQHYDLKELHDIGQRLAAKGLRYDKGEHVPERRIDLLCRRLENSRLVVIAAINGNAMGGGLEIALACDFRIAELGDYMIGVPEIAVGQLPGAGGTQRLTRVVGVAKALDLMLHGRRMSPEQALSFGVVVDAVSNALAEANNRANDLARHHGASLAHIKKLVYRAYDGSFYDGLDMERRLFLNLLSSEEGLARLGDVCNNGLDFRTLEDAS